MPKTLEQIRNQMVNNQMLYPGACLDIPMKAVEIILAGRGKNEFFIECDKVWNLAVECCKEDGE